jgi:nucleotidyltransferase/DNA polymerase involved in DNA repair
MPQIFRTGIADALRCYRREAAVIRGILQRFTDVIEPLSLDEAYLDIRAHPGAPGALAQFIAR